MKRKHLDPGVYKIRKIFNLFFWDQCEICKHDFRREFGWEVTHRWSDQTIYVCGSCVKDRADVLNVIEDTRKINELKGGI